MKAKIILFTCIALFFCSCEPLLLSPMVSDCNPSLSWLEHFIPMPDSLLPAKNPMRIISMEPPMTEEERQYEEAVEEAKRLFYDRYQYDELLWLKGSTSTNQLDIWHHTYFNCAAKVVVSASYNEEEGMLQFIEEEQFPDGAEANCICYKTTYATVNIPLSNCHRIVIGHDTIHIDVTDRVDTLIVLSSWN